MISQPTGIAFSEYVDQTSMSKGNVIHVAAYDIARVRDYYAMVTALLSKRQIHVTGAKFWKATNVMKIGADITRYHSKFHYDMHVAESNMGGHLIQDLMNDKFGLNMELVTTVDEVKDPKKIAEGRSMPKYSTIDWLEYARQMGIVTFPPPEVWNDGMIELDRQRESFIAKRGMGKAKYEAAHPEDHDDGIMALAILAHTARHHTLDLGSRSMNMTSGCDYGEQVPRSEKDATLSKEYVKQRLSTKAGFKITDVEVDSQ